MLYMSYNFEYFTNFACSIFCLSKNATKIMSEKNVTMGTKTHLVQKSEHRERREGGEREKKFKKENEKQKIKKYYKYYK